MALNDRVIKKKKTGKMESNSGRVGGQEKKYFHWHVCSYRKQRQ